MGAINETFAPLLVIGYADTLLSADISVWCCTEYFLLQNVFCSECFMSQESQQFHLFVEIFHVWLVIMCWIFMEKIVNGNTFKCI